MAKDPLKGVFCLQATPFDKNDELDEAALRNNVRYLVEKSRGRQFSIVTTGSIGEIYAQSDEERKKVMQIVIDEANGKVPVFNGTGMPGTKETVRLSKFSQDIGANGVLVILPYYHIPSEDGMYAHFETLSRNVDFDIILYNNPDVTKTWVKPHLMARIAKLDNLAADKENTSSLALASAMVKAVEGTRASILCGLGEFMYAYEAQMGVRGFASGFSNCDPTLPLDLYEAASSSNHAKVQEIIKRMQPYFAFRNKVQRARAGTSMLGPTLEQHHTYISIFKQSMNAVGLSAGDVRLPLVGLTNDEKNELKEVLKKMGIPGAK